ncbi:MAG: PDZ domain-containing protein [Campylobacterota bacterium]|nr:PDZ domain-containing protein [Campylobacterota bacterium]
MHPTLTRGVEHTHPTLTNGVEHTHPTLTNGVEHTHPARTNGTEHTRVIFLVLLFLTTSLSACSGDFALCKQKFIDAQVLDGNRLLLPVTETTNLLYSSTVPKREVVKADPFLGLYLVKSTKSFEHPYTMTSKKASEVAAVDTYMALPGKLRRSQSGLNRLAQFNQPLFAPCIINDTCCALEGIVTHQGIIEKAYIRHFLDSDIPAYGDAGMRLKERGGQIVIESIDPFVENNPFQSGDKILRYEGKKVRSLKALDQSILLGGTGKACNFSLERQGKPLNVTAMIGKRYGGGLISDTYLERKGFFLDRGLIVTRSTESIKAGDKLIRVNSRAVSTWEDVRHFLRYGQGKAVLLFEREGFQFFIHVNFHQS